MPFLLQIDPIDVPNFETLVKYYGPYLGLILFLVTSILILQYIWFQKVSKTKDKEIARLVEHERALQERILHLIDNHIGYTGKKPPK